jgi:hypothetical protein
MIMNALALDTPLTIVLPLALVLALSIVLFRLLREERRRSDARVAALIEASASAAPDEDIFRPRVTAIWEMPAADVTGVSEMFAAPEGSSPWGRRIAVAAGVAILVSTAGYVLLSRDTTMTDAAAQSAATAAAAPLELLSLRHSQQPGSLTITGLGQNPRSGVSRSRVTATAFLFAEDGTFLASGRAPLDFSTIGPGEESPFVVTVPVTGTVARYRVGFRGEDGRVIAHVDRRASGTMALRN